MPRKLGMLILSPVEHTCRTPVSNSTIDFFLMGPGLSRLMFGVSAVMSWEIKPHRPVQLKVRSDALSLRQLVYRNYQRFPVDVPLALGSVQHVGKVPLLTPHRQWHVPYTIRRVRLGKFSTVRGRIL